MMRAGAFGSGRDARGTTAAPRAPPRPGVHEPGPMDARGTPAAASTSSLRHPVWQCRRTHPSPCGGPTGGSTDRLGLSSSCPGHRICHPSPPRARATASARDMSRDRRTARSAGGLACLSALGGTRTGHEPTRRIPCPRGNPRVGQGDFNTAQLPPQGYHRQAFLPQAVHRANGNTDATCVGGEITERRWGDGGRWGGRLVFHGWTIDASNGLSSVY